MDLSHLTSEPAPLPRATTAVDAESKPRNKRTVPVALATMPALDALHDIADALSNDECAIVVGMNASGVALANRMRPVRRYTGSDARPKVKHEVSTTNVVTGTDAKVFRSDPVFETDEEGNATGVQAVDENGKLLTVSTPVATYVDVPGLPWSVEDAQPATAWDKVLLVFPAEQVPDPEWTESVPWAVECPLITLYRVDEIEVSKQGERSYRSADAQTLTVGGIRFSFQVTIGYRLDSAPSVSARIYQGGKAVETDAALLAAAAHAAARKAQGVDAASILATAETLDADQVADAVSLLNS